MMSYRWTPWYDMALDAGAQPGTEAEHMAYLIEQNQQEAEQRRQHERWLEAQADEAQRAALGEGTE